MGFPEAPMNPSIIVPWILTLATISVSAWQYNATSAQKNREPFLQKQLEYAIKASDTLATLAVETDAGEWEKARIGFWKLYWGPLAIVEDRDVERAMVEAHAIVPKQPVANPVLPMTSLNTSSLHLAHAARNMILKSWNVELPGLQGKSP
jgi:hypothetical protein